MNMLKLTPICAALMAVGLAGCADNDGVADDGDLVAPAVTADADLDDGMATDDVAVTVATTDGGTYLADAAGNSLYMLEDDGACVGACLEAWPPVLVTDAQPVVDPGSNLDPALIGTVTRDDGTMQLTYNGRPLYRYAADTGANRIAGHGLEDQWGHWYLVSPMGTEFEAGHTADASMIDDGRADSSVAEDATRDRGPADTSPTELDTH